MQAYNDHNEALGQVEDFDSKRMKELLEESGVDHVRVFKKKVEKARKKNKAARAARRKQRRR